MTEFMNTGKKYAEIVPESSFLTEHSLNFSHVILPQEIAKNVPKTHLMTETEWRNLGVQQSVGWVHYMLHAPEPHVLLFRRPISDTVPVATQSSSTTDSIVTNNWGQRGQ